MTPNLPFDIHCLIIREVSHPEDLLSLSLTCAAFRDEAQRQLFYYPVPRSAHAQTLLLKSIRSYEQGGRIGSMVRIYKHHFITRASYSNLESYAEFLREWGELRSALFQMRNLQQLSLPRLPSQLHDRPYRESSANLIVLELSVRGEHVAETIHYLLTKPMTSLRHLTINLVSSFELSVLRQKLASYIDEPTFCPRLESLRAPHGLAALFFNKKLRHVRRYQTVDDCSLLSDEHKAAIEYLAMPYELFGVDNASRLTSLVVLELPSRWAFHCPPSEATYKLDHLCLLPNLRVLILPVTITTRITFVVSTLDYTSRRLAPRLFGECRGLERIEMQLNDCIPHKFARFLAPLTLKDGDTGEIIMEYELVSAEEVYREWKIGPFD